MTWLWNKCALYPALVSQTQLTHLSFVFPLCVRTALRKHHRSVTAVPQAPHGQRRDQAEPRRPNPQPQRRPRSRRGQQGPAGARRAQLPAGGAEKPDEGASDVRGAAQGPTNVMWLNGAESEFWGLGVRSGEQKRETQCVTLGSELMKVRCYLTIPVNCRLSPQYVNLDRDGKDWSASLWSNGYEMDHMFTQQITQVPVDYYILIIVCVKHLLLLVWIYFISQYSSLPSHDR